MCLQRAGDLVLVVIACPFCLSAIKLGMPDRHFERRVVHWFHRLDSISDEQLERLAGLYMLSSRAAAGRPKSFYHRYLSIVYGELLRRGLESAWDRQVAYTKDLEL